jgi:prevent-host-death family protein
MTRYVSATDANRQFSEILGEAAKGETVVITRRGQPVAQLAPYVPDEPASRASKAREDLLAALEVGLPLGGERFDRDSLYDR